MHVRLGLFLSLFLGLLSARGADSVLIFSEIQYHPQDELTQAEWVELRSLQGVDVDISGWRIEGGIDYTFPSGSIVTGGSYVVVASIPGQIPGSVGPFSGKLDNGGETIRLVNRNGRVMDEVSYDDGGDWPVAADGSGVTLARRIGSAASGPANWAASTNIGGTPGIKNFVEPGDPPTLTTLVPLTGVWKYRDDNTPQPATWNTIAFDDSSWLAGGSLLYAGSPNVSGAGQGLYGYWPLEETSGTVAPNLVAGGTAGSLFTGATWVTDATRGKVLNFDGVDGYVAAGTIPQMTLTNDFTWSFWANSSQSSGNVVLGNRYSTSGGEWNPREFIKFTPQSLQFHRSAVGEDIDYADMPLSAWVHHALVKQGTSLTYYRNGVSTGSRLISQGLNNPQPFFFGGDRTLENWAGRLDEIAIWTKALPASSIQGIASGTLTPLTAPTGNPGGALTTQLTQGPTTHYFRRSFTFNGVKERTTLTLQHMVDDGAVIYLNGAEVARVNMPAGAVAHSTPAASDIDGAFLSNAITIPTAALVVGTNVLAVEVHQHSSNPDMVFGASLQAAETADSGAVDSLVFSEISGAGDGSFFIELQNRSGSTINAAGYVLKTSAGASIQLPAQEIAPGGFASFTASALGFIPDDGMRLTLFNPGGTTYRDSREVTTRLRGLTADGTWGYPTTPSPGAVNVTSVSQAVVINEIFYKAPNDLPEQWLELYNRTNAPVDVSGWELSEGVDYSFAAGTSIPAGGYLVVAWDPAAFTTRHPGVTAVGPWSGQLSGSGETITLRDANRNTVDKVTYADGGRWSEWADGGGSSLELRDARADNSMGEAWDASDETSRSSWVTVSGDVYRGVATNTNAPDPVLYNEFVFGLLDSGEFLIDDISVKNVTAGNLELIQNGTFDSGTTGTWRIIGTHSGTVVEDPASPGNKVLKIHAARATEHMHNHAETTLKSGASYHSINAGQTYAISFRAKWLRGSNRLHTRLWHNRLPRQTLLNMPTTGGTPGMANTAARANIGPTFQDLSHSPTIPAASEPAIVRIKVADPDGLGTVELLTSIGGAAFSTSAMVPSGDGTYTATIPGQAAGAQAQFYIRATDAAGETSFFPPAGPASRAMIPWQDGRAQLQLPSGARPHNIRVVLPAADATELYKAENLMSDAAIPCTIIYDERDVYYRAGVRLKSSEHGRISDTRCGYTVEFAGDELFLGIHDTISIDRSGGTSAGQKEVLLKTLSNLAGGIYASEDDIIRVIGAVGAAPPGSFTGASFTGPAILSKTRLDREFLDSQFADGGNGSMFKYERIYVLTQTINPATRVKTGIDGTNILTALSENPKVPQDTTSPPGVAVTSLGTNKEAYRWYWLIQNARDTDNYSGIMNVAQAIGQAGGSTAFNTLVSQNIDVSSWLRATVPSTLFGVTDNYLGTGSGQHNALIYFPPAGKAVLMPWDLDFLSQSNPTATLATGGDVGKFIANPIWKRLYYGHMLDVLNRSFNTATMSRWASHYSRFGTDDMTSSLSYLNARATYARDVINGTNGQVAPIAPITFARTSANPATVGTPFATVTGDGWINIASIRLQGSSQPLQITWTDDNSWSVQLPLIPGTNSYTLVAYDSLGAQLGTTAVTITATGDTFPAGPGTLALSEIHYNPAGNADDTEFVELLNVTNATLDLAGCHFDEESGQGIAYTFPTTPSLPLGPGERIIIARNRSAFLTAYPAATPQLAPGQFDPSALDNNGETIALYAASGQEIFRVSYTDNVAGTDGSGRSLIQVPPGSQIATPAWRASSVSGGNPGTSDSLAFSGSAIADIDQDRLPLLLEYSFGTSDSIPSPDQCRITRDPFGKPLLSFPHALNADATNLTIEASANANGPWEPTTAVLVNTTLSSNIATETWRIDQPVGSGSLFLRVRATLR
jgi:hypothetical protein